MAGNQPNRDSGFLLSFLTSRESWIQQNIQFADQKAQILIAIDSAIVGALYSTGLLEDFSAPEVLGATATSILVIAVLACVMVLVPRGTLLKGELSNSIEFGRWSSKKYSDRLITASDQEVLADLSAFVTSLAAICSRKYRYIPIAVRLSAAGWLIAGIWVLSGALFD